MKSLINGVFGVTILLMFLLLLPSGKMPAQTEGQIGPVKNTINSPSAASVVYRQFTGYVPELYTGAVDIPIPVYEVKVGGYSIPIGIRYSSNGIKVDDDPYPLGYGWMLQPGLRITCTIMDRPDIDYKKNIRESGLDFDYSKRAMYNPRKGTQLSDTSCRDTQYDIYSIHLPFGDYSFVLDMDSCRGISEGNLLKIVFDKNTKSFLVTDEKGIQYTFEPGELNSDDMYTSWLLSSITMPGEGNVITLSWGYYTHSTLGIGTVLGGNVIKDYKTADYGNSPSETSAEFEGAQEAGLLTTGATYSSMAHLRGITFPGGDVSFFYKGPTNPLIDSIVVKNIYHKRVKYVCFTYGENKDRRLLKKLYISGEGEYTFQYDPQRFDNYYSQDYWGYYNGKNNSSLPPRIRLLVYDRQGLSGRYETYGYADRSIDSTAMRANMLTSITYPTGGSTTFSYEPQEFDGTVPTAPGVAPEYRFALSKGSGVRLKKEVTTACDGTLMTRLYKYGTNEDGKGNSSSQPTLDTFVDEFYAYSVYGRNEHYGNRGVNFRNLFLNMQSNYMQYNYNTPPVWYGTVTEYFGDGSKTVYSFDHPVPEDVFPQNLFKDFYHRSIFSLNNCFSRGIVLTNEKQYRKTDSGYSLAAETLYNYSVDEKTEKRLYTVFVNRKELSFMPDGPDFLLSDNGNVISQEYGQLQPAYLSSDYYENNPCYIKFYREELQSKEERQYTDQGAISRTENYVYADNGILIRQQTSISSSGDHLRENFIYTGDCDSVSGTQKVILRAMKRLNQIAFPVAETTTVGGSSITRRAEYVSLGNDLYLPASVFFKKGTGPQVCTGRYDYDSRGNIRGVTENESDKYVFLWSYHSLYPVAKVEGMNYAELVAQTGEALINSIANDPNGGTGYFSSLREATGGSGLVHTFEYFPLIGLKAITDPRGMSTAYSYDSQGRLKDMADCDGNTLYQYAYQLKDAMLDVDFSTAGSYLYGDNVNVTAAVSGGSEFYSYVWTLRNGSGSVIYTSTESDMPSASIRPSQGGSLTLTCTVTDKMTGRSTTCARAFNVSYPEVQFSNISSSGNTLSAQVSVPDSVEITVYVDCLAASQSDIKVYAAGTFYQYTGVASGEINVPLPAGGGAFSIDIENASQGDQVTLTITSVPSPWIIGRDASVTLSIQ